MELKLYLQMLQKSWWIVLLTALAALNAALIVDMQATPQYATSARFLISPNRAVLVNQADIVRILDTQTFVPTYADIWNTEDLFRATGDNLKIGNGVYEYTRQAVVLPDSYVIELTVIGPNPTLATLIANTLGELAINKANELNPVVYVTFLDKAFVPNKNISPQPARDAGVAVALGLAVGMVLALLREQLRVPFESLRRRVITDSESSAFTRGHFQHSLEEELQRRLTGEVTLALVQLTGMEDIYDNIPATVRQRLLHNVTRTFQKELRGGDSVGRWGDTSFGVLLPATPAAAATRTLERIQQALMKPVEVDRSGEKIEMAPYIGLAIGPGSEPASVLIEHAEAALAKARQMRQHLVLYKPE